MRRKITENIGGIGIICYKNVRKIFFSILTCISPKLNVAVRYREVFHKWLSWECPETFQEKLLWLKVNDYNSNPLVIKCADKYSVRDYLKECGCGEILNKLYGVYNSADDIEWDKLPEKFVLKWNFGAGMNIICKDKSILDEVTVVKQMKKWGKSKYWLPHSEMQYKYIQKRIICEAYLEDNEFVVLPDYKVYCFNGEPRAILVMLGRGGQISSQFYDVQWNKLKNSQKYTTIIGDVGKPKCLQEMLDAAKKLSKAFPFVRCDFYIVNGKLYFGEMTFTPAAGMYVSETKIHGKDMSEYLDLNIH